MDSNITTLVISATKPRIFILPGVRLRASVETREETILVKGFISSKSNIQSIKIWVGYVDGICQSLMDKPKTVHGRDVAEEFCGSYRRMFMEDCPLDPNSPIHCYFEPTYL